MKNIYIFFFTTFSTLAFAQAQSTPPLADKQEDTLQSKLPTDKTVYEFVEAQIQPKFPGGDAALNKYLARETHYPKLAKDIGVEGKVYASFIIDKKGRVTNVEIYRGIKTTTAINGKEVSEENRQHYEHAANEINQEVIRVVKAMPKWKPGFSAGKRVRVRYILPLYFKLP